MTNQEIDSFLEGATIKQELIESIEALRTELRKAMAPIFTGEPKLKEAPQFDETRGDSISEEQDYIYESDLNQYEKAVLLFMHHRSTWPQSTNAIAEACSISTSSVKRVISKFMLSGAIMRAPHEPGYLLTKFKNQ